MAPKKNPFWLFAMEFKSKQARLGRHLSNEKVTTEAGEIWATMSDQEKRPYVRKAKDEKIAGRRPNEKYTSQGIPLSQIEREKVERDTEERVMKKEIEDTVKHGFASDTLADQKYYFVMANYFAKTVEGSIFVPAEIAISEYSLRDGVNNTFHSFVNPGTCIFGHAYEAQLHADDTHKLPLPPNAMGEKDFGKLFSAILEFIRSYDGENRYPPLYTHRESIPIIKSILTFLKTDLDADDIELKVYPIHYLFYTLKCATSEKGEQKKPATIYITDAIFDRDCYEYHIGISCDFHDKEDVSKFCALSCVVRWGYMFSDYMCHDLALRMKPGRHIPINADLTAIKGNDSTYNFNDNDNESCITERSGFSTALCSDITLPKIERDIDGASSVNLSSNNFPALAANLQRSKKNSIGNIEQNSKDENPWAVRSKVKARSPNDDSFNFASVVTGRGRGIAIKSETTSRSSQRGYGRGNLSPN